jgi:hypothetical protein
VKAVLGGVLSFIALGVDDLAQPAGSAPDVVAALERIRDTGVFPEHLSLEYVELHRAVAEIVQRDPHGYAAHLASRVLTSSCRPSLAVELEFSVGPLLGVTGLPSWPDIPAFRQGRLEHEHRRSLDISSLSELAAAFTRPSSTWPVPDLRVLSTDIVDSPLVPSPGEEVTVEFTLHNDGRQDARARVEFWFDGGAGIEQAERVDFVADVPAGRFYRFTRSTWLPHGPGTGFAGLSAQLAPPRGSVKAVEERNASNNDAVQLLGGPGGGPR